MAAHKTQPQVEKKNTGVFPSSLEAVQRSVQSAAIPVDRSYPPFSLEVDAALLSALALVFCKLWSRFSIFLFWRFVFLFVWFALHGNHIKKNKK